MKTTNLFNIFCLMKHIRTWIYSQKTGCFFFITRLCYTISITNLTPLYPSFVFLYIIYKTMLLSEEAMAPHSGPLAWKIPWTEEPGRLPSMESLRVRLDWVTSLSLFIFMHWRRKWQPTPVFLPGESQGRGSLVGCRLWGPTESDTTEVT